MSDDFKQITSTNLLYQKHYPRWRFLYESYVGGQTYRDAQHLTRYQLETDKEYSARLAVTPLQNECQSVISVYNSFLFREECERDYGGIENLFETQDFLKDADYEGRSFNDFMAEVSIWNQVFGHSWVLVSKPNINAVTRADEIAEGVRPYVSILTPLVVLDWTWERTASGRYELTFLKYVEDVNGSVQTIKQWTKEEIRTTVVNFDNSTVLDDIVEPNQLGLIPAVISYDKRSITRGIGISAINDIADMQRFIYNALSEVDQSIRLDSHPSLVKTADTLAGVGAGGIIQMPENLDGNLKPYILDFAGANITNIYESIDNTVKAIEKMSNIGSVRGTQATTMSGISREMEFQLLNSNLSEKADNLELTEEQIWRLFCMYQGQTYNMSIEYPSSFNLQDTGREIAELKVAADTNPSDPRVKAAIDIKLLDWLALDEDELAALEDTNIMVPDSIQEPGELPNTD